VVLGGERVGKTAIIEQFIFGNHVIGQGGLPTLGDVYEATIETEKGPSEKLHIFDTPGSLFTEGDNDYEQEHFLSIADGYILVYEITSKLSYDLVVSLRQKIATKNKDAPIVILANKRDLNAIREVDTGKASQLCKAHGVKFYEVTVLDRDGLKEPMCYMAWRMANPGRPFPHLPSLSPSTSSRNTSTATTASQSQLSVSHKHTPLSLSSPHNRSPILHHHEEQTDHNEQVSISEHEGEGEEEGEEEESPESSLKPFPDDAQFPKRTAGGLFFADCLSGRNKYRDDVI
jgi:NF-kappa-B inhibitor-interacting Ras-like protein